METKTTQQLNDYFERFFEESTKLNELYEVEDNQGMIHMVDKDCVLETIKNLDQDNKHKVMVVFTKIDFLDGDINHFIEYLLKGVFN